MSDADAHCTVASLLQSGVVLGNSLRHSRDQLVLFAMFHEEVHIEFAGKLFDPVQSGGRCRTVDRHERRCAKLTAEGCDDVRAQVPFHAKLRDARRVVVLPDGTHTISGFLNPIDFTQTLETRTDHVNKRGIVPRAKEKDTDTVGRLATFCHKRQCLQQLGLLAVGHPHIHAILRLHGQAQFLVPSSGTAVYGHERTRALRTPEHLQHVTSQVPTCAELRHACSKGIFGDSLHPVGRRLYVNDREELP
mmetsp:Transcript_41065/g.108718  ORF Transcript_41065/g.108718 Transcript_41065/m.108718 type:complete len:248 (-) Transcript_41065:4-747(-)